MGRLEVQEVTHDELLMRLWEKRNSLCDNLDVHFALSAVVELHKPWSMETGPEGDNETETVIGCSCVPELPAFLNPYPCATIQAIEKQLI